MIRSVSEVPVLALTATVTAKVKNDITKYLYIKDDASVVAVIPDRYNVLKFRQTYTNQLYLVTVKMYLSDFVFNYIS